MMESDKFLCSNHCHKGTTANHICMAGLGKDVESLMCRHNQAVVAMVNSDHCKDNFLLQLLCYLFIKAYFEISFYIKVKDKYRGRYLVKKSGSGAQPLYQNQWWNSYRFSSQTGNLPIGSNCLLLLVVNVIQNFVYIPYSTITLS